MPSHAARSSATEGPAPQTPAHINSTIEAFLARHPNSLLLEDGRTLFDLREARYSLASENDRATLHLWSQDRNLVRRVLAVTPRSQTLRLTTQRFGQPRPQTLELTPDIHLRTPTARETTRQRYLRLLDRVLLRAFPDETSEGFRSSLDLERSFGPAFARGALTRGQHATAVVAVNAAESQTTIDGILTVAILWLQHCRDHSATTATRKTRFYGTLRLILPRGTAATTLSRLAWLNPRIAQYELYELDETTEDLTRRDPDDQGNLTTRLLHAPNQAAALGRFAEAIPKILDLLPPNTRLLGLDTTHLPARSQPHPSTSLSRPDPRPSTSSSRPDPRLTISSSRPEPQAKWRDPHIAPPPNSPESQPSHKPQQSRVPHSSQLHRDGWVAATGLSSAPQPPAHRNHTPAPHPQTCEIRLRSNTELVFLLHGLEFASIRSSFAGQSFNRQLEITVGSAPEILLLPSTESHLRELIRHLFDRRQPNPAPASNQAHDSHHPTPASNHAQDPLFRTQPERWLESTLRADLSSLDPCLEDSPVYTGVPAFTGAGANLDRGTLDLLAVTRAQRLAIIELKTSEDLHLALQGLDYWIRVRQHHLGNVDPSTGLQQHGYFPGTRLRSEPPHLYLVAPALHIHPATETILRHLSPTVPWTLVALDERWRTRIKPIWRKRSTISS